MGIDPDDDSYDEGLSCALCEATLFGGKTPLTVRATITDIQQCPGKLGVPGNGSINMDQSLPCHWHGFDGVWHYDYQLSIGQSSFNITAGFVRCFSDGNQPECADSFANTIPDCLNILNAGIGGTVEIFWGPHLDKDPL